MKKSLLVSTLILLLSASQCFGISYSKAIVLPSNSAYESNTLKAWEDEWMMAEGDSVQLDINLSDVPEPLITAGILIEYDPSQLNIVSADIKGGWDQGMSNIVKDPNGPGSYMITTGNLSLVNPDDDGDISLASIQFECVDTCEGVITIKTVPGFDSVVGNSAGVYDEDISSNYFDIDPNAPSTTTTIDEFPSIDIKPKQVWKSRWIPLPYLMIITGKEISKESFEDLSYDPSNNLFSFPPIVLSKYFILSFIWVMPGMVDQTVTASVLTEKGVLEDQFEILSIGFSPKPSFGSISPDQGEQESILTDVTITGANTTFEDDGVDQIIFSPSGITVDQVSIESNTVVECDITIATDAPPIGNYTVTVRYDNGNKSITGINVFEVSEKHTTTTIPTVCGDVWPPPSSAEAMDCGDGVVDDRDETELGELVKGIAEGTRELTNCQLLKGDVPNGTPPYCGDPAGTDNCESDGVLHIYDYMTIHDKVQGGNNCCDYCDYGNIF